MERMSWKDGWHYDGKDFRYYVEDGKIVRGVERNRPVYPYIEDKKYGGYEIVSGYYKANRRNYEKLIWF